VVNDSLGHSIGDQLLIESARRLSACLRTDDTIARLGGDEFVILTEEIKNVTGVTLIADRIQRDIGFPFEIDQQRVFVSVSMGIVLSAPRYQDTQEILRDADNAMYRAKSRGRGRYEIFDTTMLDHAITRLEIENEMRGALEHGEFILYYQPILALPAQQVVGFEALMRWQHPRRGVVPPADFIPIAEETGLIVPMGQWVLQQACRQLREWQLLFPMDPPLGININISAKQLREPDLSEMIVQVLADSKLDAHCLNLELTESLILEDAGWVNATLAELHDLGVQVQIDDFGTGYSSLGYLQRLPINVLKIDRTFVSNMGAQGNGSEIVRTILTLAHDLGIKAIAEGVENNEQLQKLNELQCEFVQGFLFAQPLNLNAANTMIANLASHQSRMQSNRI